VEATTLLIFACSVPGEAGRQFFFHGEGPYEVVRSVDEAEVASQHAAFFLTVKNSVPPGTVLYWVECRRAENFSAPQVPDLVLRHRNRWKVHGVPLHIIAWTFDSVAQAQTFREKAIDDAETAETLKAGCFYYIRLTHGEWHVGVFLSCDDIAEEIRERIAQIASDSGILQLIPPPEDAVLTAIRGFDSVTPDAIQRKDLNNEDLLF
jgi:hypothetical protein